MKNSNDTIWNRTSDLPICSTSLITTVPNVNYKILWGIFSVDAPRMTVLSRGKAASAGTSRDSCRARDNDGKKLFQLNVVETV